jgi:hypothetical protein
MGEMAEILCAKTCRFCETKPKEINEDNDMNCGQIELSYMEK